MKIDNRTDWDTRALKTIACRVARGEFEQRRLDRFVLHVIYGKGNAWRSRGPYSGYAYRNSRDATVRVPRPAIIRRSRKFGSVATSTATFNGKAFAYVVVHEMAHAIRGLTHKQMGNGWRGEGPVYDWAATVKVEPRIPVAKPKPTLSEKREERREHALAKAKEWDGKAKAALRRAKNWKMVALRADRALAASKSVEGETHD